MEMLKKVPKIQLYNHSKADFKQSKTEGTRRKIESQFAEIL